ncbi:hypothetical protein EV426DRAFT_643752 [Tirmania nivea]|nr:hypothetical protein EV426DRAFT_643752 [Tirmania nivea]
MADPLSIVASVAALISISASVANRLHASRKDLPTSISRIRDELDQLNVIFRHAKLLFEGQAKKKTSTSELPKLLLHELRTLEKKLNDLSRLAEPSSAQSSPSLARRLLMQIKCVLHGEAKAGAIIQDIQRHKSSLHIMLTLMQCNAALETSESLESLRQLVENISGKIISDYPRQLSMINSDINSTGYLQAVSLFTTICSSSILESTAGLQFDDTESTIIPTSSPPIHSSTCIGIKFLMQRLHGSQVNVSRSDEAGNRSPFSTRP